VSPINSPVITVNSF